MNSTTPEEVMQSLLKSLSPVERRIYWRWSLVVLAFYVLLIVVGGGAVLVHRWTLTPTAEAAATYTTSGKAAEKIRPGMSAQIAR
jgi:hypothetical protein